MSILLKPVNEAKQAERIEAGQPAPFFQEIQDFLGVPTRELLHVIRVSSATWSRRKEDGGPLNFDATETAYRLRRAIADAARAISEDHAALWMTTPNPFLEGKTPFEACRNEPEGLLVTRLLQNIESGSYS